MAAILKGWRERHETTDVESLLQTKEIDASAQLPIGEGNELWDSGRTSTTPGWSRGRREMSGM